MKKLAALFLFLAMSVQAQNVRALKDVMEDMGSAYKIVTLNVTLGNLGPKTQSESDTIVKTIRESMNIMPDTILSLPNIEQEAAKQSYLKHLKEAESLAIELNNAIKSQDSAKAKDLVQKLNASKKSGHKEFKN